MDRFRYLSGLVFHDPVARFSGPMTPLVFLAGLWYPSELLPIVSIALVCALVTIWRLATAHWDLVKPVLRVRHIAARNPYTQDAHILEGENKMQFNYRHHRLGLLNPTPKRLDGVRVVFKAPPRPPATVLCDTALTVMGEKGVGTFSINGLSERWVDVVAERWRFDEPLCHEVIPQYAALWSDPTYRHDIGAGPHLVTLQVQGRDFPSIDVVCQLAETELGELRLTVQSVETPALALTGLADA